MFAGKRVISPFEVGSHMSDIASSLSDLSLLGWSRKLPIYPIRVHAETPTEGR